MIEEDYKGRLLIDRYQKLLLLLSNRGDVCDKIFLVVELGTRRINRKRILHETARCYHSIKDGNTQGFIAGQNFKSAVLKRIECAYGMIFGLHLLISSRSSSFQFVYVSFQVVSARFRSFQLVSGRSGV